MRYTSVLFVLTSLIASISAAPIDTSSLDASIKQIETPKNIEIDCDPTDPTCRATNKGLLHTVNEFEGHLGKQTGIITTAAANAADDEGQADLGDTLRNNGQTLKYDLQGRADDKPVNAALKELAPEVYPKQQFKDVGKTLETQGKVVQDLGDGVYEVTNEADRQFDVFSSGCQFHCDEGIDGFVPI